MRQITLLILVAFSGIGIGLIENVTTAESNLAAIKISEAKILADIEFLASDERAGRDTGSTEILEAARFIHKQFEEAGLKSPEGMPNGLQKFSIAGRSKQGKEMTLLATLQDKKKSWRIDDEFRVCSFGGKGKVAGEVVFCGYGIDDAENHFDEFANIDLKGKIALIVRRVPRQNVFGSLYMSKTGKIDTQRAALRAKLKNAQKHGAVAVIFVNDIASTKEKKDKLIPFGYGGNAAGKVIPAFHITQEKADQLLKTGLGKTLADIESAIDEKMLPQSQLLSGVHLEGNADIISNSVEGLNVIGILEPQDVKEGTENIETIVVGAHYDHVGWGGQGSLAPGTKAIHNGADDNASGTTALLELVRRITERDERFSRRIIFIAFSAEEKGLLGSKYYVNHPVVPLLNTIAMINLDMVGRLADEKLTVFGLGSSSVWSKILDESERETELNFFREKKAFGPSDHASFYEKQIPVLHLFTGLHEDYHRPTDDIEDVNIQGIRRIVDVLEHLVVEVARAETRPDYIENKKWISVGRHAGGRPRIGLIPDLNDTSSGFALLAIEHNSPAHHADLRAGDVILKVNQAEVTTRKDFWKVVDSLKPKTKISITFRRGEEVDETEVELGNPR